MDCRRAEELLSDHHEGTLEEPLLSELQRHLEACPDCGSLRAALGEVVADLRSSPDLEEPSGLAERVTRAVLARSRTRPLRARFAPAMPAWLQAAAAGLALAVTGTVLIAVGTDAPARLLTRAFDRTENAGAYLLEKKDRLVEDIRLLRVVVGTAFEGRVERMSDRVDDYRRLLERRRQSEQEQKKNRGSNTTPASELFAGFSNHAVRIDVTSS